MIQDRVEETSKTVEQIHDPVVDTEYDHRAIGQEK